MWKISRKDVAVIITCLIALMIPYIFILSIYINKIHYVHVEDYLETDLLTCVIFEMELEDTSLYVEGAIALRGVAENYTRENKYLYFKDNKTGEMYVTRVGEMVIGDRLSSVINDGKDYSIGGFAAKLDLKSLDIANNSYSIYGGEQNLGMNMITDTLIDVEYGELVYR